jgi:hypothetical protein
MIILQLAKEMSSGRNISVSYLGIAHLLVAGDPVVKVLNASDRALGPLGCQVGILNVRCKVLRRAADATATPVRQECSVCIGGILGGVGLETILDRALIIVQQSRVVLDGADGFRLRFGQSLRCEASSETRLQ